MAFCLQLAGGECHDSCKLFPCFAAPSYPGFDKQETRFKRLIKDQNNHSDLEEGIRRLVLCSGKDCKSNLSEFDDVQGHPGFDKQGTRFKCLIKDQNNHSDLEEGIIRLVLCSGNIYYELDEERKNANGKNIAICMVEQLCPFPYDLIQWELKRYPNAEIV
ncbi:2-oxoglutarate dehydrogenase [Forsythia ovata]|uniref:2-oxoglutarate dehydrogenase n=1 Tax=Forsythia ovata TaxID=205694 RepID=A0ABD1VPM8_9LAMI